MSDVPLTPSKGWLLIRQAEMEDVTPGGIILPATAKEKAMSAANGRFPFVLLVVAAPEGSAFAPGDRVFPLLTPTNNVPVVLDPLKQRMVGTEIQPDFFLIREEDIAGRGTWTTSIPQHAGISEPIESADAPAN